MSKTALLDMFALNYIDKSDYYYYLLLLYIDIANENVNEARE